MLVAIGAVGAILLAQAVLVWRVHRLHLTPSKIAWDQVLADRQRELDAIDG